MLLLLLLLRPVVLARTLRGATPFCTVADRGRRMLSGIELAHDRIIAFIPFCIDR